MLKYIFKCTTGSFGRTIGRILAYIAIAAAILLLGSFINIANVNAADTLVSSGSTAGQQFYSGYIQTYSDRIADIQNLGYTSIPRSGYYIFNGVNAGVSNIIEYVSPYFAIDITNMNIKPDTYYRVVFNIVQGGYIQYNASAISSSVKCSLYNGSSWVDNLTDACTTSINGNTFTTYVHTKGSGSGIALFFGKTGVVSSNDYLFKNTYSGTQGIRIESYSVYMTNDFSGELGSINNSIDASNKILDDINGKQDQTNQKLDETNNFLKDDTPPDADISSLGNVQGLLPPGPVDSLLNIPFNFLSIVVSSLSGTCVPLQSTFVFDSTLTYPCFSDFYDNVPPGIMIFFNIIPSAFILIIYFKHLYKKVDRAMSLESNSDDEWGVL